MQDQCIFSWKPNPAHLAGVSFSPELVRDYIRNAIKAADGCILEIILKDTHTCNNRPERFDRWARTAQQLTQEC